jgi:HlyD family secretion protein
MRGFSAAALVVLFVSAGAAAEEQRVLSLIAAQPVQSGAITATGRIVPQLSVRVGSRLSAHIVEWGKGPGDEPLDVGMAVKGGQRLFRIDPTTFQARLAGAGAARDSARAALENLKAPTRPERIDVLRTAIAELDARIADREREEARYRRLVEVDKTMPVKRLEEVVLELGLLRVQRKAAQARLAEAETGPTKTEIALAEARVKEAQAGMDTATLDVNDADVKAPFDGVITKRWKGLGDYVSAMPFIEILELTTVDRLEADLRLPEAFLPHVVPGRTRVALRSPLLASDLDLPVARIVPDVDAQMGTFGFRVAIPPDRRGGLAPGAFVTAALALEGTAGGVILPLRALGTDGGKTVVWVAENGKMVRREIEAGDRLTEGVVVKSGVRSGERVVVGPADQLKDGATLPEYLRSEKP